MASAFQAEIASVRIRHGAFDVNIYIIYISIRKDMMLWNYNEYIYRQAQ